MHVYYLFFMAQRLENFISLHDIYAVGVAVTLPVSSMHTPSIFGEGCVRMHTAFCKYEASPPLSIPNILHMIHTTEENHVNTFMQNNLLFLFIFPSLEFSSTKYEVLYSRSFCNSIFLIVRKKRNTIHLHVCVCWRR